MASVTKGNEIINMNLKMMNIENRSEKKIDADAKDVFYVQDARAMGAEAGGKQRAF